LGPGRLEPKSARRAKPPGWAQAFAPHKRGIIAGAALAAMMIGIVVNALALQHGRRVALATDPAPVAAIAPKADDAATPAAPAPAPAAKPQATLASATPPRAQKSGDAIADLLHTQQPGPDKRKLTLAAQDALAKLGFSVKANGALDAKTRKALADFEKSNNLPASTEITAKLVRSLKAAAAAR
jgi:hypothetical protein